MDGPRFAAWTRRRFGLVAGSLAAALGLARDGDIAAKKKRKKRCKKLGVGFQHGSRRKKCCGDLLCLTTEASLGAKTFCCKAEGTSCTSDVDCCEELGLGCAPDGFCREVGISDRSAKANFGSVDPVDMLERVRALPITTWNYTSDDPAVRHIGPMAQDFAAAFGTGADDRHIHPMDGQGVALAAIQGLLDQVTELRGENARLAARILALEEAS